MKYRILTYILFLSTMPLFSQNENARYETVKDFDGNIYHTISIGNQIWMKENLRTTHYRNGEEILTTTPSTKDISEEENLDPLIAKDLSTPAYPSNRGSSDKLPKYQWVYNGDESNAAVYGRLYTWYAANDERKVCPSGWHVSSDAEWAMLLEYLGGNTLAGGKLKEEGTAHWAEPNTGATNESGFTALGAGSRNVDGTFGNILKLGAWWTTGPIAQYNLKSFSVFRHIEHDDPYTYRNYNYNSRINGFSVRCVKD